MHGPRIMFKSPMSAAAICITVGTLVLASCSEGSAEPESAKRASPAFDLQSVPKPQRGLLSDGIVSVSEYLTAFHEFESCARAAGSGITVLKQDAASGLITYSSPGDLSPPGTLASTPLDKCYQRDFAYVELVFQTTDPTALATLASEEQTYFDDVIRPCLISNGTDPGHPAIGTKAYGAATKAALDDFGTGDC